MPPINPELLQKLLDPLVSYLPSNKEVPIKFNEEVLKPSLLQWPWTSSLVGSLLEGPWTSLLEVFALAGSGRALDFFADGALDFCLFGIRFSLSPIATHTKLICVNIESYNKHFYTGCNHVACT